MIVRDYNFILKYLSSIWLQTSEVENSFLSMALSWDFRFDS